MRKSKLDPIEVATLIFIAIFTALGFFLSYTNHDYFKNAFVVEDGFIEWSTVVGLTLGMSVCFWRVWILHKQRPALFLIMIALTGLLFLFGAGEEISWGQRLFNIESSEFFKSHNAQRELNLHNLVVNDTKINKLVFGKLLGIALLIYLFGIGPLYRYNRKVRTIFDKLAIPIATNYQTATYVILLIVIQILMVSSKKGELLEFALSFVFFLNIAFPYNRIIFIPPDPDTAQQN